MSKSVTERPSAELAAEQIRKERFPEARAVFLCGSVTRGEETENSDLDLVVVFERLATAYRDSFHHQGWPVEVFVHDPETLHYFFREIDWPSGVPTLPSMVWEGKELPGPSEFSRQLKELARSVLESGPPTWSEPELRRHRYAITDLLDDLKSPRDRAGLLATGSELFSRLADFHFRAQGKWSGRGKAIARLLRKSDPSLAAGYEEAFDRLFSRGDPQGVLELACGILAPFGGPLFDHARADAPPKWRRTLPPQAGLSPMELGEGFSISDFLPSDGPDIVEHLQERQIYDQTLNIPFPYTEQHAREWLAIVAEETRRMGRSINWAIRRGDGKPIGGIGFHAMDAGIPFKAEIGYWLAKPYWNRGIMTRAVRAASELGFRELGLSRITANVFIFNPGSARVLEKAGFRLEGVLRGHYRKDGRVFDGKVFARLRDDA